MGQGTVLGMAEKKKKKVLLPKVPSTGHGETKNHQAKKAQWD